MSRAPICDSFIAFCNARLKGNKQINKFLILTDIQAAPKFEAGKKPARAEVNSNRGSITRANQNGG